MIAFWRAPGTSMVREIGAVVRPYSVPRKWDPGRRASRVGETMSVSDTLDRGRELFGRPT